MRYKQLCNYCDGVLAGTIVFYKVSPPEGADDVDIYKAIMRVKCHRCNILIGYYKYSIHSSRKYIIFGRRTMYTIIPGNACDGREYELSGYTTNPHRTRRSHGIYNIEPIEISEYLIEEYPVYMKGWENDY